MKKVSCAKVKKVEMKAVKMTDKALDPYTGMLRYRLDHTLLHFPVPNKKVHANCQLHLWMTKKKYRKQLMQCPVCNVVLCIECYRPFHVIPNLIDLKNDKTSEEV